MAEQARVKECYSLSYSELQGLRARARENAKNMGNRDGQVTDGRTEKRTDDRRTETDDRRTDGETNRETDRQRNGQTEKRTDDR